MSASHPHFGPRILCSLPLPCHQGWGDEAELLGCLISCCFLLLFSVCSASTKAILNFLVVFRSRPSFPVLFLRSHFAVPDWFCCSWVILLPFLAQKGGNELGTSFRIAVVKNISSNMHNKCTQILEILGLACSVIPERLWLSFNYLWYRFWNIKSSTSDAFFKTQGKVFFSCCLLGTDVTRLVFWPCGDLVSLFFGFFLFCLLLSAQVLLLNYRALLAVHDFWFQSNSHSSPQKYFQ